MLFPLTPALGHNTCTTTEVWVTVVFHGVVTDTLGNPVDGATVTGTSSRETKTTTTNATGAYAFHIRNDCPVTISVSHPLYVSPPSYHSDTPTADSAAPVDFRMPFRVTTSVSPPAFNSVPKLLTFTSDTTAPVDVRVPIELPGGSTVDLMRDETAVMPSGWIRWTGTWEVPASATDGQYLYKSCVLSVTTTSNCGTGSGVLSEIAQATYTVDRVSPTVDQALPTDAHNTLARRPIISARLTDALSGISASTIVLTIDGLPVSATYQPADGSVSYLPATDLSLGVHTASLSASDAAGNSVSRAWDFNVMTLTGSSVSTAPVERAMSIPAGTETISFSGVPLTLGAYDASFSSLAFIGYGEVSRTVDLSGGEVIFSNSETSVTQPIDLGSTTFSQKVGAILPEPDDTTARLPAHSITISSPSIAVPEAYRGGDSTATLRLPTTAAGPIATASEDPTSQPIPNGRSIVLVAASSAYEVTDSPSAVSASVSPTTVTAYIELPDGTRVPIPYQNIVPPLLASEMVFSDNPQRTCAGVKATTSCFYVGADPDGGSMASSRAHVNLGGGAMQLFSTQWLYRRVDTPVWIDWQQSSGKVSNAIECRGGAITLKLTRFTNESSLGAASVGLWNRGQFAKPDIPVTIRQTATLLAWADGTNSLDKTAYHYSPSSEISYEGPGTSDSSAIGIWSNPNGSSGAPDVAEEGREQMATGAEWTPAGLGIHAMALNQVHDWTILYDKAC